jgi:REP element-mobilizing transposase RayT
MTNTELTLNLLDINVATCKFVHMHELLGWHLIFSAYGFWLPNDQRGSGSTRVRAQHLYEVAGEATKVTTRHSVAHRPHDVVARHAAKSALKYPPVRLSGVQARAVARGIATIIPKIKLVVHACAIMPDHVHLVVRRHHLNGDEHLECLKRATTRGLNNEGLHPMAAFARANGRIPSPWAAQGWKVMLHRPGDARSHRLC